MSTKEITTQKTGPGSGGVSALITGKDERLGILSEAPLVLETPHHLLAGKTITPKPILFVRNIQQLPEGLPLEPLPLSDWDFELTGLIDQAVTIRGSDLLQ